MPPKSSKSKVAPVQTAGSAGDSLQSSGSGGDSDDEMASVGATGVDDLKNQLLTSDPIIT